MSLQNKLKTLKWSIDLLSPFTVILDANVLYPALVRDVLIQCASDGLFRAKLTDQINQEWKTNLLKKRPDISIDQLNRTCELFERAMPDCMVTDYESLIDSLTLPDEKDRHVLAAAIRCNAQIIVTFNTKDFPSEELKKFDIQATHPDTFLRSQADLSLPIFLSSIKTIIKRLKKPPKTPDEYLIELASRELIQTASFLKDYLHLL